jgi:acylphosphatase
MIAPERKILRIVVSGHVQGVGFRAFLAHAAARLRLGGWTRNLGSDKVETLVAGSTEALAEFCDLARRGPPGARVESFSEIEEAGESLGADFFVAPSA